MMESAGIGEQVPRLIRLGLDDNVLIVTKSIEVGEEFAIEGVWHRTRVLIPTGFKVAAKDLIPGDVVIRLSTPIGLVTRPIQTGEIVHTDNMESKYFKDKEQENR